MTTLEFRAMQKKLAQYQNRMRENPTKAEARVKQCLDQMGIKYVFQKGFLRDKTLRIVDFYFPFPVMMVLEIDGGYHEKQQRYDRYREGRIIMQRKGSLRFVRLTNDKVLSWREEYLTEVLRKNIFCPPD